MDIRTSKFYKTKPFTIIKTEHGEINMAGLKKFLIFDPAFLAEEKNARI